VIPAQYVHPLIEGIRYNDQLTAMLGAIQIEPEPEPEAVPTLLQLPQPENKEKEIADALELIQEYNDFVTRFSDLSDTEKDRFSEIGEKYQASRDLVQALFFGVQV
jgi:hypothetical protein